MTEDVVAGRRARPADIDLTAGFVPFDFSQGPRPLCLAFAASSAHKLLRAQEDDFSPEALWRTCRENGLTSEGGTTIDAMGFALRSEGQPVLRVWPYNDALGQQSEEVPHEARNAPWHTAVLTSVPLSPGGQEHIEAALASGRPVVIAIAVSDEFSFVTGSDVVEVPADIPYFQGYHAVLIVGATWKEETGRIYRILNSWGTDWADGGYTWLPAGYVDRYTVGAAAIG